MEPVGAGEEAARGGGSFSPLFSEVDCGLLVLKRGMASWVLDDQTWALLHLRWLLPANRIWRVLSFDTGAILVVVLEFLPLLRLLLLPVHLLDQLMHLCLRKAVLQGLAWFW